MGFSNSVHVTPLDILAAENSYNAMAEKCQNLSYKNDWQPPYQSHIIMNGRFNITFLLVMCI